MKRLTVSRATAGFIARGHPWVRPDRFTRGLEHLQPGEEVVLIDEHGDGLASALADPQAPVCARVYDRRPGIEFSPLEAFDQAWERRAPLHIDAETDCYRLVHGEADGLPGLRVERYGNVIVVLELAACAASAAAAIARAVAARLPGTVVVIRQHREDLRRAGPISRRLDEVAIDPEVEVTAHELGVDLRLRPFAALATGIYVDQRGTRRWLRERCADKRVLNLFAYTGLFSTSLLNAEAALAHDVDLSAPALRRALETAQRNGVAGRYAQTHGDCLAFLRRDRAEWDLIIVDPPTAAQGGEGWNSQRDYPELLALALPRLAARGVLVACSNTIGKPIPLDRLVVDAARTVAVRQATLATPPLERDIPQLAGFPEGRPFRITVAQRSG